MNLHPLTQVIIVALIVLSGLLSFAGPTSFMIASAIAGLFAGLVLGVATQGIPRGLLSGFLFGLFIDVLFLIAGGLSRYIRTRGSAVWRAFLEKRRK